MNISNRQVQDWLRKQETFQLHKIPRKKDVVDGLVGVKEENQLWFIDLIDMSSISNYNKGYNWIMTIVDAYTRLGRAYPLKEKTPKLIVEGLRSIGILPKKIQTDNGKEFVNETFKNYLSSNGVKHLRGRPHNPTDQALVERYNGTIKQRLHKYFTSSGKFEWLKALPELVKSINSERHRIIRRTPIEVASGIEPNPLPRKSNIPIISKVKQGDNVRLLLPKGALDKGTRVRWTREIYPVEKTFKVRGVNFVKVNGQRYQENEVQKVIDVERPDNIQSNIQKRISKKDMKEMKELEEETEKPERIKRTKRISYKERPPVKSFFKR